MSVNHICIVVATFDQTKLIPFLSTSGQGSGEGSGLAACLHALHCTALHCTALHCTVVRAGNALPPLTQIHFRVTLFLDAGILHSPHCTALHCTALHCTALHCTALHCTAPHCTALHCTALHCTALHSQQKQVGPKWDGKTIPAAATLELDAKLCESYYRNKATGELLNPAKLTN
jgi:hypothetical protein